MTIRYVELLESGYWHVRFGANKFFQFPKGQPPTMQDGFGWVTEGERLEAERAVAAREHAEKGRE